MQNIKTVQMQWINRLFVISALFLLVGCASAPSKQDRLQEAFQGNTAMSYDEAANLFTGDGGGIDFNGKLDEALLAGKAFHDAGRWQESTDAFEVASGYLIWKADKIDTLAEVGSVIKRTLLSDTSDDYRGKIYEGVLIDYYQALNSIFLGDEAKARVHFNRLELRQGNAEVQFTGFVNALNRVDVEAGGNKRNLNRTLQGNDLKKGIASAPKASPLEIRIAAADVLGAIFRSRSGNAFDQKSDKAASHLAFAKRVALAQNLDTQAINALEQALNKTDQNLIFVFYEDGRGPSIEEFRVDLPLFLVSNDVLYSGIALPKFKRGVSTSNKFSVKSSTVETDLQQISNINRMASLEFRATYQKKVNKEVLSAIVKTIAQAAANQAAEQSSDDVLFTTLFKVATGALQYSLTNADTRHWVNLPDQIQFAVIENPNDGSVSLQNKYNEAYRIDIAPNKDVILYLRSTATNRELAGYIQHLPLNEAGKSVTLSPTTN